MTEANYDTGYSKAPGFKGIKAQPSLDYRYFNEDVGYGLVFMQNLGKKLQVDIPYISATIRLISLLMDRDYLVEAKRTIESLGLSAYNVEDLVKILT
jgi:opine dehydrogenase